MKSNMKMMRITIVIWRDWRRKRVPKRTMETDTVMARKKATLRKMKLQVSTERTQILQTLILRKNSSRLRSSCNSFQI